jgi:polyvinyl alcohol dehydrogenase (cytochrome)
MDSSALGRGSKAVAWTCYRLLLAVVPLFYLTCPAGTRSLDGSAVPSGGKCAAANAPFEDPMSAPHWNGWGVDVAQHRFQPASMARLASGDLLHLKLKWAFGFPGAVRSVAQPTIFGGHIFVGSETGKVYSLDAKSGCTYWEFDADADVRSAIVVGEDTSGWIAYFGDQHANVYAVNAVTGTLLWKVRSEKHPLAIITGSPTLGGGVLFVPVASSEEVAAADPQYSCCSFRGSLSAFDAATGRLLWKSFTIPEAPTARGANSVGAQLMGPSGAAILSSPTFDIAKGMIYATTGNNYSDPPTDTSDAILAFSAGSGELKWSRQITTSDAYNLGCGPSRSNANCPASNTSASDGPDLDFASSAILVDLPNGKRALVAEQKSGVVTAVDSDRQGEVLWQRRIGGGGDVDGIQWGIASDGSKIYAAVSDVKVDAVVPGTPGAQVSKLNARVAFLLNGRVGGGLHALKVDSGDEIWQTPHPGCNDAPKCTPAQSAAVTVIPGVVFSGGLDGHLRGYSALDGQILWDVDTKAEYSTVNGVAARGGSIDGGGAIVVGGTLYVTSGAGKVGTIPGNVLLAYSIDGK